MRNGYWLFSKNNRLMSEYISWRHAISRCYNKNDKSYNYYGGRGITVCAEWHNDFQEFLRDVGRKPSIRHSLDRYPNNNGNYEPGNVRWATKSEQMQNRRSNQLITLNGETLCLAAWAKIVDKNYTTIYQRIKKGWSIERALNSPVRRLLNQD